MTDTGNKMREEKYIMTIVAIIAIVAVVSMTMIGTNKSADQTSEDNIGYAAHPVYSSFEQPINTFSIDKTAVLFSSSDTQQTLTITTNDTAVYSAAYISINSGAWQQVTLTGTVLGGSWLTGNAQATITIPKTNIAEGTSNENYIIIYSCTRNSSGWDCHDSKWQLMIFNTTKNTASQNPAIIYAINAGGIQYTSSVDGTVYSADTYYTGGTAWDSGSVLSIPDATIYNTERWGVFAYNLPVTNGDYQVTLKFAELYYSSIGERRFNVSIEGQRVLTQFDIIQSAGGANKSVDRTFNITVSDGSLDISFEKGSADNPKISAIVITGYDGMTTNITNNTHTCTGSDNQPCAITNGQGIQYRTCDTSTGNWSTYGTCTLTSCNNGYTQSGNTCIDASSQTINPIVNPYGGKVYYVSSSSGNDSNNGTSVNSPWKTLTKVNSTVLNAGDIVAFKRGDIFYGSMTIKNSGTNSAPIRFTSYGTGDKPVITGFTAVTGWNNLGGNIWESTNTVSNLSKVNMVTINGVNTAMGRYPKVNAVNTGYLTFQSHSGLTSITSSDLSGTPNWAGAEVVIRPNAYKIDRSTITSQSAGTLNYNNILNYPQDGSGFFIQNDPRTLTQQNDWYYNKTSHKINVYSTSQPTNVNAASIERLVTIQGNYIIFDSLTFTGANGCGIYASSGTYNHISVAYSSFSNIGVSAIYTYVNYLNVENSSFNDSNNNAISTDSGTNITIRNNDFLNIGVLQGMKDLRDYPLANSNIEAYQTVDYILEYNNVTNVGYDGINFYGRNVLVKNNYFNRYCAILNDGGAIYTYTGNRAAMSNVNITGNIAVYSPDTADGISYALASPGIYLDYASANVEISYNSVGNTYGEGIYASSGGHVNVHDNTVFNASHYQLIFAIDDNATLSSTDQVKYNILVSALKDPVDEPGNYWDFQKSLVYDAGAIPYSSGPINDSEQAVRIQAINLDYNCYARPIAEDDVVFITADNWADSLITLAQWKTWSGQDAHSYGSPKSITNVNDLRFEYNPTRTAKTITLDVPYIDMKNQTYSGSVTLQPYTSIILIKK